MLVAMFVAPSGVTGSALAVPALPHTAGSIATHDGSSDERSAAPHAPKAVIWQNTTIQAAGHGGGANVAFNWSFRDNVPGITISIDLSSTPGQNLSILGGEFVGYGFYRLGLDAFLVGTTTYVVPSVELNGSIYLDTAVKLPNPGQYEFRMVHTGGDWWQFSVNSNLIIVNGGNGTYNLTAPAAFAFGPHAPSLNVSEAGPTLPISTNSFSALLNPALETNASATSGGAQPTSGIYIATKTTAPVPMIGENQAAGTIFAGLVPNDFVVVNPGSLVTGQVTPTTTNGTYLWGAPGGGGGGGVTIHNWLGAETQDPTDANVSGAQITSVIPSNNVHVPHQEGFSNSVVVPVNASYDLALELADLNVTVPVVNITLVGTYPIVAVYNQTVLLDFWINLVQTPGSTDVFAIQQTQGGWWSVYMNGALLNAGWTNDSGGAGWNGTFDLGPTTMWGDTGFTFAASPISLFGLGSLTGPVLITNQPMLAFFGNYSNYWIPSSVQLKTTAGWTTPLWGYSWAWGSTKDFPDTLIGSDQDTGLLPGAIIVGNITADGVNAVLHNGTVLWTATLVRILASPYTIESGSSLATGGNSELVILITFAGAPVANVALTTCSDALGLGECESPSGQGFVANDNDPGVYYDNFTATTVVSTLQQDQLTFIVTTSNGPAVGTVLINVTAPVTLAALLQGHGSSVTLQPGNSLTIVAWTNQTLNTPYTTGVTVEGVFQPKSDGPACTLTYSAGVWSCTITLYSTLPCATSTCQTSISVATSGPGVNVASVTLDVTIQSFSMTASAITATVQGGAALDDVPAGVNITFSVTVSSPSGPVTTATVTFSVVPAINGVSSFPITTETGGVYSVEISMPRSLASVSWYNVTAQATAAGYASSSSPGKVNFAVWPPTTTCSSNCGSSSGSGILSSPAVLGGIIAVVAVAAIALVLLLRKKGGKKPSEGEPEAWSGPAPSATTSEPPAGGEEPPPA
jgi:hypothetical protein